MSEPAALQFLENRAWRSRVDSLGGAVWSNCRRRYRHLLESRRTEPTRRNEPFRHAYRLARRYTIQFPRLSHADRKSRYTWCKCNLPLSSRHGDHNTAKPDGTGLWFSAWDAAVSMAYSRQLYEKESGVKLSLGLNAKYIHQQIHRESATGMAVDVGTLYHTGWNSLRIGMCFSNFGPEMRFGGPDLQAGAEEAGDPRTADYLPFPDTTNPARKAELETVEFPLPSNFRLGIAYDLMMMRTTFSPLQSMAIIPPTIMSGFTSG